MKYWPTIICISLAAACSPLPSDAINEALTKLHYKPGGWIGETKCVGTFPSGVAKDANCYAARNASTSPEEGEANAIRAFWVKDSYGRRHLSLIVDQSDNILWRSGMS